MGTATTSTTDFPTPARGGSRVATEQELREMLGALASRFSGRSAPAPERA